MSARELRNPFFLCGYALGLELYRHRWFEASFHVLTPEHRRHDIPCSKAGHWKPGNFISVCGNCSPIALSKKAMGIDWMKRAELTQAIPPFYTEFIGKQLLASI